MADQVDRAKELEEMMLAEALHDHRCRARLVLGDGDRTVEVGACIDCGEDIPAERMAAVPHAKRCVDCQELWERFV